jgi:hypothetical protein
MGKRGHVQSEKVICKWGPLPSLGPPPTDEEEEDARAVQDLGRLALDARYYLDDSKPPHESRRVLDECIWLLEWVPSSREDFERALAEFHRKVNDALLGRGNPSYLDFLAENIAILEDRKDPPAFPRGERTKTVIQECFVRLWTEGENWLTRKEFFEMCSTELKVQNSHAIAYRHFVRILENTGLDEYFPPMRRRRKRSRRLNSSIDS